ncbi:MAG: sigma-54-dependent Fis family transcriptional regulator [Polyangiaceae bacterium]|nr:sigma-54-dependent Fis family transcriptional regulator [Polyangiaceae bacterium]
MGAETEQAVRVTATGRLGCVYVVEDEPLVRRAVCRALGAGGFTVRDFETASEALAALTEHADEVDVLITDVLMPGKTGFDLLTEAHARWRDIPVLLMTGQATVSAAVEAMRLGAYDYLVKPVDPQNTLIPAVRRAIEHKRLVARNRFLESQLQASQRAQGLVGESAAMRQVGAHVSAVAPADVTVLVLGESGTGKELVARAVHQQSDRSGRPFVDVNCAALTDSLLESELFGHMKGAFTGATSARRGLFETASSGTLFMDEVGELAPTTQARLLRVLQEGTIRPVGSSESRKVNVRIIAATNRDLAKEVRGRTLPTGSVLPPERVQHRDPAAARASRGHPGVGPALPPQARPAPRPRQASRRARDPRGADRLPLAGKRARAREHRRTSVGALPGRHHHGRPLASDATRERGQPGPACQRLAHFAAAGRRPRRVHAGLPGASAGRGRGQRRRGRPPVGHGRLELPPPGQARAGKPRRRRRRLSQAAFPHSLGAQRVRRRRTASCLSWQTRASVTPRRWPISRSVSSSPQVRSTMV